MLAGLGPAALLLLMVVIFAETGLLVGFFLPGDSLLFAAGLLVAAGTIPLPLGLVIAGTGASAVAGDQVAYAIGHRYGARLLARHRTRWWSRRHLLAARGFFERHGPQAVVLARFVPLARTFTPVVAGAVGMPRRRFTTYNVIGGFAWTAGVTLAGYFLGGVPLIAAHVELAILALVAASLLPATWSLIRRLRARRREARTQSQSGHRQAPGPNLVPDHIHPTETHERTVPRRPHHAPWCHRRRTQHGQDPAQQGPRGHRPVLDRQDPLHHRRRDRRGLPGR